MKSSKLLIALSATAIVLCLALPVSSFAADGAAVYKAKCAMCHGPEGQGKVGPALKGTNLSADQIVALLSNGDDAKKPPHKKALNGVSADDAKAVADFVKSLK
ncbi:MAG: cytochrome c [Terriglobales bacterium]|jgi:mono/diheme cytochrome c family protein